MVSIMTDGLHDGIIKWLEFTKPLIEKIVSYTWAGPDSEQFFEFLQRAAVVRQKEAIEAALKMDEAGHAHFAVTFLRPAYEELIWIEYLNQHSDVASELVSLMGFSETTKSLDAQNQYLGARVMNDLGFTQRFIKIQDAECKKREARIREIGRALGWPQDRSLLPPMGWLSMKVKRERQYNFLYHATSRFVHFSQQELLRRVWGKQGKVDIGSTTFAAYWRNFGLYWSFYLYVHLIIVCSEAFGDAEPIESMWDEMKEYMRKFNPQPIITHEELRPWPGETARKH